MTTKLGLDSKSDNSLPPPYNAISIQSKRSSARSVRSDQNCADGRSRTIDPSRDADLSRVRNLVVTPDFTAAVVPIVNPYALSPAELSDHLQSLNMGGHTPVYWAIVNSRQEAITAYVAFISSFPISSACSSDLRLGCMVTSNHAVFTQLKLGHAVGCNNEPLKRSLGCPPDEIEMHERDGLDSGHGFVTLFRFEMCQKRLRILQNVNAEFVAGTYMVVAHLFGDARKVVRVVRSF